MTNINRCLIIASLALGGCPKGTGDDEGTTLPPAEDWLEVPSAVDPEPHASWTRSPPQPTMDGAGDPNATPIHVWFASVDGEPERVYVLGHAEHECCHKVSGAIAKTQWEPEFRSTAWLSYGAGKFDARGSASARQRLAGLRRQLGDFAQEDTCAGQLIIHDLSGDPIADATADIIAVSESAFDAAQATGRPFMLWYELPKDVPAFVPALAVKGGNGALAAVSFVLGEGELQYPTTVVKNVSIDGVGQLISDIRGDIDLIATGLALHELAGLAGKRPVEYKGSRIHRRTVRAAGSLALQQAIAADLQEFEDLIALYDRVLERANKRSAYVEDTLVKYRQQYVEPRDKTRKALATLQEGGEGTHEIEYHELFGPRYASDIIDGLPSQKTFQDQLRISLENLDYALGLQSSPPPDPRVPLIDASIRGWPATFGEPSAETAYDDWAQQHQLRLHQLIDQRLGGEGFGVSLADVFGYRVLFHVSADASSYRVQPLYALNDGFYIVVDPSSGSVRYEAANADENLYHGES